MEYRHLMKDIKKNVYKKSFKNELEILAQGVSKRVKAKDTILLVEYKYIPSERQKDITYGLIVVYYIPQK